MQKITWKEWVEKWTKANSQIEKVGLVHGIFSAVNCQSEAEEDERFETLLVLSHRWCRGSVVDDSEFGKAVKILCQNVFVGKKTSPERPDLIVREGNLEKLLNFFLDDGFPNPNQTSREHEIVVDTVRWMLESSFSESHGYYRQLAAVRPTILKILTLYRPRELFWLLETGRHVGTDTPSLEDNRLGPLSSEDLKVLEEIALEKGGVFWVGEKWNPVGTVEEAVALGSIPGMIVMLARNYQQQKSVQDEREEIERQRKELEKRAREIGQKSNS